MTKLKTRRNLTFTPDEWRILAELAAARGVSISQLIGQLAREEAARVAQNSEL